MADRDQTTAWEAWCLQWRGRVLTGRYAHCCPDWDELPIDETCPEWDCGCRFDENGIDING